MSDEHKRVVFGNPLRLLILVTGVGVLALPTGFGHTLMVGLAVVVAAHEAGHYVAARRGGLTATVKVDGWVPGVATTEPMTRTMYLAGPLASLMVGGAVLAALVILLVILIHVDQTLASVGVPVTTAQIVSSGEGHLGPLAELFGAVPVIAVLDALFNMMTLTVICSVAGGAFFVAGKPIPAVLAGATALVGSLKGWKVSDGDHYFALRSQNAHST